MKHSVRYLTRAALVAALYLLLTFVFQAFGFGAVQLRVSEALMLLPAAAGFAVPGLFVGCLAANLLCGAVWYDVVFGSLATLIAALIVRALRKRLWIAAAVPAVVNGLIVGTVVYFAYVPGTGAGALFSAMATVALGELIVCYALGIPLVKAMQKNGK